MKDFKELAEELKQAGYTRVAIVEVEDGRTDIHCSPAGLLNPATNNFAALDVLEQAGVMAEDVRVFDQTLILRNPRR
jgi:hypothetical protein